MKCKALRGFYLADALVPKGATVDVPDHLVRTLESIGKIERAPEPTAQPAAAAKADKPKAAAKPAPKPAPMTTQSASALVPGAATQEKQHD